jgi:hypothetical protein
MIKLRSLLFEVSIDQLKQQFVDSGKLDQSVFNDIVTASGSKSAYATWLTKMVVSGIIQTEDIYKYNSYFKLFDRRKREYPFQDINQYKNVDAIRQFITKSVELANAEQRDPSQQKGVSKADKYQEFRIGSVAGFNVYKIPQGRDDLYGASCELGSGTEWCTATGKTREYFDDYVKKGPLFIFIKPGSDEKYQFSYETESFMDEADIPIPGYQTNNEMLAQLFQFIENYDSKYKIPWKIKAKLKILTKDDLRIPELYLDYDEEGYITLPDNLTVTGDFINDGFYLSNENETLPKNLKVSGKLGLASTSTRQLPPDLKVGKLHLIGEELLTEIPQGVYIGKTLEIKDCESLKKLPNDMYLTDLYIWNTPIETLPSGLVVTGECYLHGTNISELPDDIEIYGELSIMDSPIMDKYTAEELKKRYSIDGDTYYLTPDMFSHPPETLKRD